MELRQLQHFIAVAEELHFTRAAARVHVVQSTLSASISSLEDELGATLLVRNSRRVSLTAAGHAFLPDAQRVLAAADNARSAVNAVQGVLRGQLTIGLIQSLEVIDLQAVLARYHQRYPGVKVTLRRGAIDNLVQATVQGDLDLAFVNRPYDAQRVRELPLGTELLALAVHREDPLAQQETVALNDLRHREFVERPTGFSTRLQIDAVCADLGFQRVICAESNSPHDLVDLVEAGYGIAFLPPALLANAGRRVVGVKTKPPIVRELAIVAPIERPLSPAAVAFLDELPAPVGRTASSE